MERRWQGPVPEKAPCWGPGEAAEGGGGGRCPASCTAHNANGMPCMQPQAGMSLIFIHGTLAPEHQADNGFKGLQGIAKDDVHHCTAVLGKSE